MPRYHLNNDGNPGICKATKSCPFGDFESDHFDSPEKARKAYEMKYELLDKCEKFSQRVGNIIENYDELIPAEESGSGRRMSFRAWIEKETKDSIYSLTKETVGYDEYLELNRDVLLSFDSINVEDPQFWKDYLSKYLNRFQERRSSPRINVNYPENFMVHSPKGKIGSLQQARKLAEIVTKFKSEDLNQLYDQTNSNFQEDLEDAGFDYVDAGYEQIVFSSGGVIWKIQKYNLGDSDGKSYVYNQLLSQELFPKMENLEHAKTSGYVFGNVGVIAQEEIFEGGKEVHPSKRMIRTLDLFGHTDFDSINYFSMDGKIVSFDSFGESFGDVDYHMLSGVEKI